MDGRCRWTCIHVHNPHFPTHSQKSSTQKQDATLEFHHMEMMQRMFDVNYFGLVRVSQAFLPLLREGKGRLINVGSVAGRCVLCCCVCNTSTSPLHYANSLSCFHHPPIRFKPKTTHNNKHNYRQSLLPPLRRLRGLQARGRSGDGRLPGRADARRRVGVVDTGTSCVCGCEGPSQKQKVGPCA